MSTISTDGVITTNGHAPDKPVRILRIVLENLGRFERYELRPGGHFTLIEGDNEEGKTTIDKAFEVFFGGGNNAKLIRNGSDQGKMVVELTDGVSFEKILRRAGKAELKMSHPEYGSIKAAQTYLERMISNHLAVNPAKMIDADPQERVEYLLTRLPIAVPTEQLQSIVMPGTKIPEGHALTVLPLLRTDLEQRRRAKRQQKEDKEGNVAELGKSLPPESDVDINQQLTDARAKLDSAKEAKGSAIGKTNSESRKLLDAIDRHLGDFIQEGNSNLEIKIAALRKAWQEDIDVEREQCKKETSRIESENELLVDNITGQYVSVIEEATKEVGRLEQAKDDFIRNENTREMYHRANEQAGKLAGEWKDLDGRVKALDALRESLTATLPIPGLTIGEDGDLWVNGITWEQVNLAKKIDVVFQLAELSSGALDFVFFDDLEHFSSKNFELFKDRALRSTKQTIANRVADVPLTVSTFEPEMEEVAA